MQIVSTSKTSAPSSPKGKVIHQNLQQSDIYFTDTFKLVPSQSK